MTVEPHCTDCFTLSGVTVEPHCTVCFILSGVTVEPHKKQLHMSLAYQFRPDKKEKLELLAKTVKTNIPVRWDIRLYSRDARIANCQVSVINILTLGFGHDALG